MRAVVVSETGGPEVLVVQDRPTPQPGRGEVRVDVAAAGVNFIDVYQRTGLYPQALPFGLGQEGAGTVIAAGAGAGVEPGARVAWVNGGGSYATHVALAAEIAVPVPDDLDTRDAAAGRVARLLRRTPAPRARRTDRVDRRGPSPGPSRQRSHPA